MRVRLLRLRELPRHGRGPAAGRAAVEGRGAPGHRRDAAPAPGCELGEDTIVNIDCGGTVSEGDVVTVRVGHGPTECCAPAAPSVTVSMGARTFDIQITRAMCECCFDCDCAGPVETAEVTLGRLAPGGYLVTAGGVSCEVSVLPAPPPPPPGACEEVAIDELRAPRTLLLGQRFVATAVSFASAGCGCEPRLEPGAAGDLALMTCDCCDVCLCVDPGYEATHYGTVEGEVGDTVRRVGDRALDVAVRDRASCEPMTPTGLRVVPPTEGLVGSALGTWWIVVEGQDDVACCSEPLPAIDEVPTSVGFTYELLTCTEDPCTCPPEAVEAWYPLGELGPGTHTVRVGELTRTISI